MAPNLKSVVSKNIRDHTTQTVLRKALEEKDGKSLEQSSETAAMVREWESLGEKRGRQSMETVDKTIQEKKPDVDGMTDEELSRISIHISSVEEEDGEQSDEKVKDEETAKFDEYKHHQFIQRWGLFQDSDGRDEEWFITDPPVLEETDPEYLCDMCRHIDFYHNETYREINYQDSPASQFTAFPRLWTRTVIVLSADSFERGLFRMGYSRMFILMIGRGCN
ncbi:hypothetical protein FBULB1_14214 [Fusarium bulbicola]|nr:hypothetical protein FBULB1_14214 [Fusarium bulbicola]